MVSRKRRGWRRIILVLVVVGLIAATIAVLVRRKPSRATMAAQNTIREAAPADLAKLRAQFIGGLEALQKGDAETAVRHLSAFSFGSRAVEEYRLYFLGNAYQLKGDMVSARRELARLWRRKPRLIYRDDVAFNIATLYSNNSSFHEASDVYGHVAARAKQPAVQAEARWNYIQARLMAGDPIAAYVAARRLLVMTPKSPHAAEAIALVRSLSSVPATGALNLNLGERIERAENLLRDGDPKSALDELSPLNADALGPPLRQRVLLTRGLAYQGMRRWADSDRVLQPLLTDQFRFAGPALRAAARNNQVLASAINPVSFKTVKEKTRAGSVKVAVKTKKKTKKKTYVTKPRYKITTRSVKIINPQLAAKKETHERLYVEHLKNFLDIPNDPARKQVLTTLLEIAEAKNQDAYMRELIPQLVKLDRLADPGLQRFWNKAWQAYAGGDLKTARQLMTFVAQTYTNPNIRRQATYWLARIDERSGRKEEAMKTYARLVDAPYNDLYAMFAEKRGARRGSRKQTSLKDTPDWNEVAEKSMPEELRLAYELTSLGAAREARLEIQDNANDSNRKWSDALLGVLFHEAGTHEVAYRYLRRAYPEIATIEQNNVPRQLLRLYYPLRYESKIVEESKARGLDPYLVMALIRQESSYNPEARSRVGATGLMQVMPATAKDIGRKINKPFAASRLTHPETNIELGTYYLKQVISWVGGSEELALAAYNGGIGNVRKWQNAFRGRKADEMLESIPFSETRGYVKRITLMRSTYEQLHEELR